MGSHSVTCHMTQVSTPHLTRRDRPVLDLRIPKGWKAELTIVSHECRGSTLIVGWSDK